MIPYGHQKIDQADIASVVKVLRSDWLTQGPKTGEFEQKLAKYCGAKYAVAACNGTAALHLAYLAAGLKQEDEVITTPNSFAATSNMLLAVGARPVFCDIRLDTYNLDENKIEKLITKKTRAIVPVHFAGQPCEMAKILKIAKKHKLLVIEDACHALGAKYKNRKIGSLKSDMAVFSFHPVKPITTGEGGAVVTNDKKCYERLKLFRNHGIHKDPSGKNVMVALGYNYRLTDIQAALGVSQLRKLDEFNKKRNEVAKFYQAHLKGIDRLILPVICPGNYSSSHIYVIRTKKNRRDELSEFLKAKGIGVNFHYPPIYSHPYYKKIGYNNKLPNVTEYQNTCLTIPCFQSLKNAEINYIVKAIKEFFTKCQ